MEPRYKVRLGFSGGTIHVVTMKPPIVRIENSKVVDLELGPVFEGGDTIAYLNPSALTHITWREV